MRQIDAGSPLEWSVSDLGAFFVENRSEFLSHAKRLTRNITKAEEIVQDSLVRVLLACPQLESKDHARSYFHRVIENLSVDLHRREGRQPNLVLLDEATREIETQWVVDPDYATVIAAADDAAIIREAISLLSPAERAALVMWEFEGRSTAEIALELGVRESAVRHTISRARAGLRRILSERIIDEQRGLTALDVLSVTYRKAEKFAQKSPKAALSLVLLFTAFLGFNSLAPRDLVVDEVYVATERPTKEGLSNLSSNSRMDSYRGELSDSLEDVQDLGSTSRQEKSNTQTFFAAAENLMFAGLDAEGAPIGFSVADSLGNVGELFQGRQQVSNTETGLLLSGIVSTKSGATNVLINQSIVVDAFGTAYLAEVSVGISGGWQPLNLSLVSSDVERLASGNYLLTVLMMVDSAVETSVKVSTSTSGTDLTSAPDFVSTRLLLNPTKTEIVAQAVLVSADSQGDGA